MASLLPSSGFAALLVASLAACKNPSVLDRRPVTLDGEWDEPQWNTAPLRGVFVSGGSIAHPYSEVRAFTLGGTLYVGLYAADEDIRSTDRFELAIGTLALTVDASGKVSDPRIKVGIDRDGTLDNSGDDDEEWVIELEIPKVMVGSGMVIEASRCDTTKAGNRRCGAWGGQRKE